GICATSASTSPPPTTTAATARWRSSSVCRRPRTTGTDPSSAASAPPSVASHKGGTQCQELWDAFSQRPVRTPRARHRIAGSNDARHVREDAMQRDIYEEDHEAFRDLVKDFVKRYVTNEARE